MAIYPNSNLPSASQPWGREIQKNVENVTAQFLSERTNNTARDAQLEASYKRLSATGIATATAVVTAQAAADAAQDAIDGLTSLGSAGSLYDIYGDNITGGTITGTTVRTAASGSRVVLNGTTNQLEFYYGTSLASTLSSSIYDSQATLWANGNLWVTGSVTTGSLSASQFDVSGTSFFFGAVDVSAEVSANSLLVTGDSNLSTGSFDGALFTFGPLYATGISATGSISTDGNLNRTTLAGGGTTGASFNTNGSLIRTTSSARYKQDISNLEVSYNDVLLLNPRRFRLKEEVAENPDAREYAGFIAEEVEETSLKIFVAYETLPDGSKRPDGIYYSELTSALAAAIKHQDTMIKALTSRIEILEGK